MSISTEGKTTKRTNRPRFVELGREEAAKGFGPSMPTCGNDLVGLWELPQEAMTQARLKIARSIPMSTRLELVRDCTVQEYSLESVAHSFGAGEYQIILNPGPQKAWLAKQARITVSADYARECGWTPFTEPIPLPAPPRFSELRSFRETAAAIDTGQGFTMEKMAGLMEAMIERVAERMKPAAPAPDPMAGMTNMLQIMSLMRGEQERSVEMALKMVGLRNPVPIADDDEEEKDDWPSVIREALPMLGQIGQGLISRAAPAPAPAPTLSTHEPEETVAVPLSQEEISRFAPAVAMLRPFAGMIVTILEKSQRGEDAAPDLAGYIPGRLVPLVIQYAEVAGTRGAEVLALIDPALVTEKGLGCMVEIGNILRKP